jgi:predicted alpha/beta-hydrolase family hydrolase
VDIVRKITEPNSHIEGLKPEFMKISEEKLTLKEAETEISYRVVLPQKPVSMFVIAHGAGAGIDHQFMVDIQNQLAAVDIATLSFNFIYMQLGKRTPYRMTQPINTFVEVWNQVRSNYDYPLFAAGKSYGGRVASMASDRLDGVKGMVFLGYPFHPPGKLDKLRTEHLYNITLPMLFLQGTRDNFSTPEIANSFVSNHGSSTIVWLEDGDHSWKPRRKSGCTQEDLMVQSSKEIRKFCEGLLN